VLGGLREPLLALGVGEQADSGEKMRSSLKDIGVDVRSRDQMYDPSCHSGHIDPSPNVQSKCDKETLFSLAIP
jgi:hypothetical protein